MHCSVSVGFRTTRGLCPEQQGDHTQNNKGTIPRTTRGACPEQQGDHTQNNKGTIPRTTRGPYPEQQGDHAQNNKGTMPRMTRGTTGPYPEQQGEPRDHTQNNKGTMPRTTRGPCPEQQGDHAKNNKGNHAQNNKGTTPRTTRGPRPEQQGDHAQNEGEHTHARNKKKISTNRDTTLYLNQNGRFTIFPSTLFTRKLAPWRRFERWSMHQQYHIHEKEKLLVPLTSHYLHLLPMSQRHIELLASPNLTWLSVYHWLSQWPI